MHWTRNIILQKEIDQAHECASELSARKLWHRSFYNFPLKKIIHSISQFISKTDQICCTDAPFTRSIKKIVSIRTRRNFIELSFRSYLISKKVVYKNIRKFIQIQESLLINKIELILQHKRQPIPDFDVFSFHL